MTDPRDPTKPPEPTAGQPVAILRNAALVGCFAPAEGNRPATLAEVMDNPTRRRAVNQPVLDALRDR